MDLPGPLSRTVAQAAADRRPPTADIATLCGIVPTLYVLLRLAGAGYLLWLAWNAIKPNGESAFVPGRVATDPPRGLFTMGLVTNLLNPETAVLYVSPLPQVTASVTVNFLIVNTAGSAARFSTSRPGLAVRLAAALIPVPSPGRKGRRSRRGASTSRLETSVGRLSSSK